MISEIIYDGLCRFLREKLLSEFVKSIKFGSVYPFKQEMITLNYRSFTIFVVINENELSLYKSAVVKSELIGVISYSNPDLFKILELTLNNSKVTKLIYE